MCKRRSRRGATLVVVLLLLATALLLSTIVVNVSAMQLARIEAQIAIDASSHAAGKCFALTGDAEEAFAAARRIARRNTVSGESLDLQPGALQFGSAWLSRAALYPSNDGAKPSRGEVRLTHDLLAGNRFDKSHMLVSLLTAACAFQPVCTANTVAGQLDIALVVDRARSRTFPDGVASAQTPAPPVTSLGKREDLLTASDARWRRVVAAVDGLLTKLESSPTRERVSLVLFADQAAEEVPLAADYTLIRQRLAAQAEPLGAVHRSLGEAILTGGDSLSGKAAAEPTTKVIVVMGEGSHNTGIAPEVAATMVADASVLIFTFTFSDEADLARMQRIAEIGAGKHFHEVDRQQLEPAYREIVRALPVFLTHESPVYRQ